MVLPLCCCATIALVASVARPSGYGEPGGRGFTTLNARRRECTEFVIKGLLRDPDSAEFQFEETGTDKLGVRVRAENGLGAHAVQTFELTFAPESVTVLAANEM